MDDARDFAHVGSELFAGLAAFFVVGRAED